MAKTALSILVAGVLLAASPHREANAQSSCDWYAKLALRQAQINDEKKCGLAGAAWHKDLAAHLKWCQGVAPDVWKAEAQKRNQQLDACGSK
ncbi:MAG: hypothetical protein JSS20_01895 [Proteobacteria bacterium]|nr:hypothetical protein [Pseudomonadota bacterium]